MMKKINYFAAIITTVLVTLQPAWAIVAVSDNEYKAGELIKIKAPLDDPRPFWDLVDGWRKLLKPETIEALTHDPDKAKAVWAEAVGFKAPDIVGKIAPEIIPGKYTLADKTRLPFDKLMSKLDYGRFNKPGDQGINVAANFTEFEVTPPRQLYHTQRLAEDTLKNVGTAKQSDDGYPLYETFMPGYPFPRPSGPQKAWQIILNSNELQHLPDDLGSYAEQAGVNTRFKEDSRSKGRFHQIKLCRRSKMAPLGQYYDKRAEKYDERYAYYYEGIAPQNIYGNAYVLIKYNNPDKPNNFLANLTLLRRIRKMSSADQQDQALNLDYSYDDVNGLDQKLSPKIYPYECRILAETERLMYHYDPTGGIYYDSK
ncbi:MAG: DUF1329 domain-containing protein, partial [Deltaproteobacteria bacterium]|nr:DUF1329 domain-containing protein [Deltaproteobacteria bacterium]